MSNSVFLPSLKNHLIETYIGKEVWKSCKHGETKLMLLKEAMIIWKKWVIKEHGGIYPYHKHLAKLNGFKSVHDYRNYLAECSGFRNHVERRNDYYKKRGYENGYNDWVKEFLKKNGFKNNAERYNYLAKKRGFNSYQELNDFNAQKKGFKNDYERQKINKRKLHEKKSKDKTICSSWHCWNKRENTKYKTCDKCRKKQRDWKRKNTSYKSS